MTVAELAELACVWEAKARKVGNVHPRARFADLEYSQFVASAAILGRAFAVNVSFPQWVLNTVTATGAAVGTNTNLGLALVLAPLAAATTVPPSFPDRARERGSAGVNRGRLKSLLNQTTVADADAVYAAVRAANPGGLGEVAEQDVREKPTVTLVEAMRLAAERDLIARQYANGFVDLFDGGVPALAEGFEKYQCVEAAIIHCQLTWLKAFPDSLIARKCGGTTAFEVQMRAAEISARGGLGTVAGRAAGVAFDAYLRSDAHRRNPGTTADLVAGCLFAALADGILSPDAPFPWAAEGWL